MPSLLDAVRLSGHAKTVLSAGRQEPIRLKEEAGVRLGVLLLAVKPLSKGRRLQEMADAVAAMTAEESYYWYAKVNQPEASRLRRALRLFLAEE